MPCTAAHYPAWPQAVSTASWPAPPSLHTGPVAGNVPLASSAQCTTHAPSAPPHWQSLGNREVLDSG